MSDPPGSSSQEFWREALALEPGNANNQSALSAEAASQLTGGNARFSNPSRPSKRPIDDGEDPYANARRRYILSPDSSEDASPVRLRHGVPSSPTSPSGAPDKTVSVSFLESNIRAGPIDGAQSYLAGDEYRPTAFGDIGDYMRKKDVKVQAQNAQLALNAEAEGIPKIFTGLSFYINGNTNPPMEVLRKTIVQRGGIVQPYLRTKSNVDYVIAPVLTIAKFKDLAKGGRLRVVKEGFIVQSAEEGRVVDWTRWRLKPEGTDGGLESFMTSQRRKEKPPSSAPGREEKNEVDAVTPTRAGPVASIHLSMAPAPSVATKSLLPTRRGAPPRPPRPKATPARCIPQSTPQTSRSEALRKPPPQPQPSHSPSSRPVPPTARPPAPPETEQRTIPVTEVPSLVTNLNQLQQQRSTSSVGATSAALDPRTAVNSSQTEYGDMIDLADVNFPMIEPAERHSELPALPPPFSDKIEPGPRPGPAKVPETEAPPAESAEAPALEVAEIETTDPDPNAPPSRAEGAWEHYALHKSNPHASRLMQTEGFREQKTAVQGAAFIDSFYQNSRLHLLSTWKAALKLLVSEARSMAGHVPRVLPAASAEHVIIHVDFDAFFVSAGLASRPHLVGKPVVVCHSSRGGRDSTSEIASASYEARAKGVKNGMSLGRARQLCGDELETIPYDFEMYKSHSTAFYAVLSAYADELEAVSIDEALLDITGAATACSMNPDEAGADPDPAKEVAARVRADIKAKTGCNVSIGIAHNILLARLATKAAKPPAGSGIFHLLPPDIPEFLAELDVNNFPSFGHSAKTKLQEAFGTTKVAPLLAQSRESLRRVLGPKTGETLHSFLRGKDERRLEPDKARKSVSAEINYAIRFTDQAEADAYMANLASEVGTRLQSIGAKGRHVTLKIMVRDKDAPVEPPKFLGHGRCETFNKSTPLPRHTNDGGVIGSECVKLLHGMRLDPVELRGIGIQVTKLEFGGDAGAGQATILFKAMGKRVEEGQQSMEAMLARTVPKQARGGMREGSDEREGTEEKSDHLSSRSPDAHSVQHSPDALIPTAPPSPEVLRIGTHASSDIDPDLLAQLPRELHAEAKAQIRASRAEGAKQRDSLPPEPPPALRVVPTRNAAAHITKQLRPKLKTQLRAGEIAELPLYTAWGRASDRQRVSRESTREPKSRSASLVPEGAEVIEIDDDDAGEEVAGYAMRELRALGLDIGVFSALPADVQAEQVEQARAEKGRQAALFRPNPNTKAKDKKRGRGTTTSPCPGAGGQRGNGLPPPIARVATKPSLFGKRDAAEVAHVLAEWVDSFPAPETKDVQRVADYLLKCLARMGLGGIEHTSTLLRSMRASLEEKGVVEGEEGWWCAWESLRDAVDEDVKAKMGSGLRL